MEATLIPSAVTPVADAASVLPPANRWRQAGCVVALFLLSRLLLAATAQIAWDHLGKAPLVPGQSPLSHGSLGELFRRADAGWYVDVIEQGYHYQVDPASRCAVGNIGFYPVYPLLARAARGLGLDTLSAGYLVSNALLLAACFLLWDLARLELRSTRAAAWAVAFALFSPGAAWFSMVFSESTFFFLLLSVLWCCRRQRWLLAAGAGFLLSLTRAVGVVAVVFVALEVWADWRERRRVNGARFGTAGDAARALALAAPVLGYLAFFVFLRWRFGDWHAQHKTMLTQWPANAYLVTPWAAFAREWPMMHTGKRLVVYGLLGAGTTLAALSYPALRRWSYPALALALLTLYVIATSHAPMARYLAVVVPLHLALAWLAVRFRGLGWATLAISAVTMLGIAAAMVNGFNFY